MKQFFKYPMRLPGMLIVPLMLLAAGAKAQLPETYGAAWTNTGYVSHQAGTGTNAFSVITGGSYDNTTFGIGTDAFVGPLGIAGAQEIAGTMAPLLGNLSFDNGTISQLNITNTAGLQIANNLTFNNGITSTVRTNRTSGLAGAIQFLTNGNYAPALTPAIGVDAVFTDGFVSKVNPSGFVYPVGNVTDLRPITATGTGTFTTAWSNSNVASFYPGPVPPGTKKVNTNGYWEWNGTNAATATISIPDQTTFTTADKLSVVGYNGTAWVNLGGGFTTNIENSNNTTPVNVPSNIVALAIGELGVIVNAKVFLQGDMPASGTIMRTSLQNYTGPGVGLLPSVSPYTGAASTYTNMSNISGTAGSVADWIRVEVRLASNNYHTAAESRSLMLKPDGTIVDSTGLSPTFSQQTGTARLVIKHRNHMAIMSNDIASFSGTVNYDFSTALAQASTIGTDPAQMKLVNGVWAMFAGDINSNNYISATDKAIFNAAFKLSLFNSYVPSDINMNGNVTAVDNAIFKSNFSGGYYSTLINY